MKYEAPISAAAPTTCGPRLSWTIPLRRLDPPEAPAVAASSMMVRSFRRTGFMILELQQSIPNRMFQGRGAADGKTRGTTNLYFCKSEHLKGV